MGVSADAAGFYEVWGDTERLQFAKKVQLKLPAKLAVAETGEAPWYERSLVTDRRRVTLMRSMAEDAATFSDVVSVLAPGQARPVQPTLESVRAEASQHQADLLLLVSRTESVEAGHNWMAGFKILLLPMLFLPTEENDVGVTLRMAVMDVRNGLIYTTAEEVVEATVTSSSVGEDDDVEAQLDALFEDAVETLRERLGDKLREYEAAAEGT